MKPLDDGQQRAVEQLLAEEAPLTRGRRVAYGTMFGVEGAALGAVLALISGVLWAVGAAIGLVAVAALAGVLRLVPSQRRLEWQVRMMVPREPDPERVRRSASIEGVSLVQREKKPYWPE